MNGWSKLASISIDGMNGTGKSTLARSMNRTFVKTNTHCPDITSGSIYNYSPLRALDYMMFHVIYDTRDAPVVFKPDIRVRPPSDERLQRSCDARTLRRRRTGAIHQQYGAVDGPFRDRVVRGERVCGQASSTFHREQRPVSGRAGVAGTRRSERRVQRLREDDGDDAVALSLVFCAPLVTALFHAVQHRIVVEL